MLHVFNAVIAIESHGGRESARRFGQRWIASRTAEHGYVRVALAPDDKANPVSFPVAARGEGR